MSNIARLPKFMLIMEALGGLFIIAALAWINHWLPAPDAIDSKTLASALLLLGVVLMLPAAWLLIWRSAKALAPELFNHTDKKR
jgi:hypothetical protein